MRSDAELAQAYRRLEDVVSDVRTAMSVVEILFEDTIAPARGDIEEAIRRRAGGLTDYRIHAITEDQDSALRYVIVHLGDLARNLHREYYAAFDQTPAAAAGGA